MPEKEIVESNDSEKINVIMQIDLRLLQKQDELLPTISDLKEVHGIYGIQKGTHFRPYLPTVEYERICPTAHKHGHFALEKTWRLVHERRYHPDLRKTVQKIRKSCHACQMRNLNKKSIAPI
uniref:Integrase catalytic domain-containing protein n=1 Tax=Strongyloides stercoralis TaxID=6248 RepID=A0A0K0E4Z0_STRER